MKQPDIRTEVVSLPEEASAGLYVAFSATPERIAKGAKVTMCKRCQNIVGHHPRDSFGHEIVCLACAGQIPAIRHHIDQLAKARGE